MATNLFDDLVRLNEVAESCAGLAFQFVESFRDFAAPEDSHAEASERLRQAQFYVVQLREAVKAWDLSPNSYRVTERIAQAIGLGQPILYVDDRSCLTAHEAAREFAARAASIWNPLESPSQDPRDLLEHLATHLQGLIVPDLSARIEGEFWEASRLIELDKESENDQDNAYLGIVLGDRTASRVLDGRELGPVEFGGKGQAWELLKMLIEAGAAGISCSDISNQFAKPYERKAQVQRAINGVLRLDIRTIGKNWTLVHFPKPGEKSPGNG